MTHGKVLQNCESIGKMGKSQNFEKMREFENIEKKTEFWTLYAQFMIYFAKTENTQTRDTWVYGKTHI